MEKLEKTVVDELKARSRIRSLSGSWNRIVSVLAIGLSCFQLYCTVLATPSPVFLRSIHLILALALIFCLYPVSQKIRLTEKVPFYDILLILTGFAAGGYIIWAYDDLVWRMGDFYTHEIVLGALLILLVLEAVRRAVGPPLAIIGSLFILYDLFGNLSPVYSHAGFSITRIVGLLYLSMEGIYGMPLGVMTSFVFLFILFSGFLRHTGAGDFLIDLSFAFMGRFRGGPAKAAALASGLFGSISGSITANVVGTGSITIPMMRRLGYKAEFAGAVEVASSTGGQMMPPIMGAGAFIMAEWTGIPYSTILFVSIIPAFAYYVSVIAFIHFNAGRMDIGQVDPREIPPLRETLKKGWHFFIPLVILMGFLVAGYSPMYSASTGIFSILIVFFIRGIFDRKNNPSLVGFLQKFSKVCLESLESGAKGAILVSVAMACAGIIMGSVGLTGIGLRISNSLIFLTNGNLFMTISMVALASLIMGMEMPVAASYIVIAILAAPALKILGVPLLAAHLIVFWFSQDAAVTPPVCLSSYAAAAISGGDPFKTGLQAWKLAKGLYIMPFLFAYTGLVTGTWMTMLKVGAMACLAFVCFAAAWEGFLIKKATFWERVVLSAGALACLFPFSTSYLAGIVLFIGIYFKQRSSLPEMTKEVL